VSGSKRKRASDSETRETPEPLSDVYVLDTDTWEWFRLAPDFGVVQAPYSASDVAGRAGHTCVVVKDCRQLIRESGLGVGAPDAGPMPAILIFGGMKGDSRTYGDVGLLILPKELGDCELSLTPPTSFSSDIAPGQPSASDPAAYPSPTRHAIPSERSTPPSFVVPSTSGLSNHAEANELTFAQRQ
jgi:hypothetical protein